MYTEYETPSEFFGAGYELGASKISFSTSDAALISVDDFTVDTETNILTIGSDHNLLVGDRVQVSSATTLPAGLAATTDYYVRTRPSATTITLGATANASEDVNITDAGTGTHSIVVAPALKEVTDAEANATTGDARKVIFGLIDMMTRRLQAITPEHRPTKITVARSTFEDSTTGEFVKTYNFTVRTESSGFEVAPE
jgi:hypothetical protein